MDWMVRFELTTFASQMQCATKLRHTQILMATAARLELANAGIKIQCVNQLHHAAIYN